MFPWLRLSRTAIATIGASRIGLLDTTRVRMRIWPNDLDFNLHVNNGRYLTLADIGRVDWFLRSGVLKLARERKALPVVGDAIAKFRRELKVDRALKSAVAWSAGINAGDFSNTASIGKNASSASSVFAVYFAVQTDRLIPARSWLGSALR